jgi:hypothetical protein
VRRAAAAAAVSREAFKWDDETEVDRSVNRSIDPSQDSVSHGISNCRTNFTRCIFY